MNPPETQECDRNFSGSFNFANKLRSVGHHMWSTAYILGHKAVSFNVNPIFIYNLSLTDELYGYISPLDPRSEGCENRDDYDDKEGTKRKYIVINS